MDNKIKFNGQWTQVWEIYVNKIQILLLSVFQIFKRSRNLSLTITCLRSRLCFVLTSYHHEEELNTDLWKIYDLSSGCFATTTKKGNAESPVEVSLVLVTQLTLIITCATYKTNAGSRSTEPGPWGRGLEIIILKSCTGLAGHRPGLGATITAPGQQLSSDVVESVCLYLTADPPLRTWASYSTSLCLSFLIHKMVTKIRPTLGVAVVLNEFIYLKYL